MTTEDEVTLWVGAFRYYCGRRTYAVGNFCDLLIAEWRGLSDRARWIIQRDLEGEFKRDEECRGKTGDYKPLGDDCDREQWERVRKLWSDDANT